MKKLIILALLLTSCSALQDLETEVVTSVRPVSTCYHPYYGWINCNSILFGYGGFYNGFIGRPYYRPGVVIVHRSGTVARSNGRRGTTTQSNGNSQGRGSTGTPTGGGGRSKTVQAQLRSLPLK